MDPIKRAYDATVLRVFKDKAKFLVSELDGAGAAVLGASALGWEVK
jgi:glucokinase